MSLGDDHGLDHGLAAGKQERAALVAQRSLPVPAVVGAPPLSPLCRLRRCRLDCCRLRRCRLGDARAFEKVVELVKFSVKRGRPKRFI